VIRVGGLTYWEIKCRALNGHRSKLSDEQLGFVGFVLTTVSKPEAEVEAWTPAARRHERIDKQLEELARLRDIAPGWIALARELVKDDEDQS
jgi:hypothetical protein